MPLMSAARAGAPSGARAVAFGSGTARDGRATTTTTTCRAPRTAPTPCAKRRAAPTTRIPGKPKCGTPRRVGASSSSTATDTPTGTGTPTPITTTTATATTTASSPATATLPLRFSAEVLHDAQQLRVQVTPPAEAVVPLPHLVWDQDGERLVASAPFGTYAEGRRDAEARREARAEAKRARDREFAWLMRAMRELAPQLSPADAPRAKAEGVLDTLHCLMRQLGR